MTESDRPRFEPRTMWGDAADRSAAEDETPAVGGTRRGGPAYGPMLESFRLLQDRFAGAALPEAVQLELTAEIDALNAKLLGHQVVEAGRVDGQRPDLPGRGSALMPPLVIHAWTDRTVTGRVAFSRLHLGGNGAVHGGAPPLIFDDILGRVANHAFTTQARTAFLTVNYRQITPIDVSLVMEASLDEVDGRKRWASARLLDDSGTVLCDANGLFVQLRPGQP